MARYKGNYKDLFKSMATYTIEGTETKTVKGESTQNYKGGMNLTVESGKLEIHAETFLDTARVASWDVDDIHDSKADSANMSMYGANVNAFGFFMVQSKWLAWASGNVVTSNGVALWVNANLVQVLFTVGNLSEFESTKKEHSGKKFSLSGIRFVTVKSEHVKANKSHVS